MTKEMALKTIQNEIWEIKEKKDVLQFILETLINQKEPVKWVSVNERQPHENNFFLVTVKYPYGEISQFPRILMYLPGTGWLLNDDEYDVEVIAWMPLPEPYKPQESGEEKCK